MTHKIIHHLAQVDHGAADGQQKAVLRTALKATGFIPNMYANMANAPDMLSTYLHGYEALHTESGLTPAEQAVVFLSISQHNGCTYCTAAHSVIADKTSQVPNPLLAALRSRQPIPDARLTALTAMSVNMVATHGQASPEIVRQFFAAGFEERDLLYIVLAAAVKTLSNHSNQAFGTELDDACAAYRVA